MSKNGAFKLDLKTARENARLEMKFVEDIAKSIGHDIDLNSIEARKVRPTAEEVDLLMAMYKLPIEERKSYMTDIAGEGSYL